jgi:hypothetical protein
VGNVLEENVVSVFRVKVYCRVRNQLVCIDRLKELLSFRSTEGGEERELSLGLKELLRRKPQNLQNNTGYLVVHMKPGV